MKNFKEEFNKIDETISTSNLKNPLFFGIMLAILGTILDIVFEWVWLIPIPASIVLVILFIITKEIQRFWNVIIFIVPTIIMFYINYSDIIT